MADRPGTVALLGGGVIGGGWAARFALNGVDVRLYDPAPEAERRRRRGARERAPRAAPAHAGAAAGRGRADASPATPEEAVAGADFVQESAPEREGLKRALLARGEPRRRARTSLIATSTSGLLPEPPAGGHGATPSGSPSATRSTLSTCCRSSSCAAASGPTRETLERARRGLPLGRDAAAACSGARSTASSPTACSRRCGARRCGSSPTTSRRSRRSTTRSASAPGCAGRAWARS